MALVRSLLGAAVCLGVGALTSCAEGASGPDAPPLDIRGRYEAGWFVGYTRTDGKEDLTLPHGYCPGDMEISSQDQDSFSGVIIVPETQLPICHAGRFPIRGKLARTYWISSSHTVFNFYDMSIESDIESFLECRYAGKTAENEQFPFRGTGRARHNGMDVDLSLAFSNVYTCSSGRWVITAGVHSGSRIGR